MLCQTPLYALPAFKRPRGKKLAKFMKLIYVYIDWTLLALAVKERDNRTEQNNVVFILFPHFEECLPSVNVNYEFIFEELHHSTSPNYLNYCC